MFIEQRSLNKKFFAGDALKNFITKGLAGLAEWLRANGMTDAQIMDCLKYIAGTTPPTSTAGK